MKTVRENLPPEAIGNARNVDAWWGHRGLEGADDDIALLIKLRHIHPMWEDYDIISSMRPSRSK